MLKHLLVNKRDVHDRKHDHQPRHDSEEKEAIAPKGAENRERAVVRRGVHIE